MIDAESCREVVEGLCEILEAGPLRIMDPRLTEIVEDITDRLEDMGRPAAAERFGQGWDVVKEQFKKSFWNFKAGSKDHAFEPPPRQAFALAPACIRCQKGVADHAQAKGYDWMFCADCRSYPDGPEMAPIFQSHVERVDAAIKKLSAELVYLKDRLAKCRG